LNTPEFHKEVKLIYLANWLAYVENNIDYSDDEVFTECCKELYISSDDWRLLAEKAVQIEKEAMTLVNVLK
jgi:hypothetical protein